MSKRSALLWALSAALLAWIVAVTVHDFKAQGCLEAGGSWEARRWHCRPAPAIELRRELQRG